jgi:hypothetical protein
MERGKDEGYSGLSLHIHTPNTSHLQYILVMWGGIRIVFKMCLYITAPVGGVVPIVALLVIIGKIAIVLIAFWHSTGQPM